MITNDKIYVAGRCSIVGWAIVRLNNPQSTEKLSAV